MLLTSQEFVRCSFKSQLAMNCSQMLTNECGTPIVEPASGAFYFKCWTTIRLGFMKKNGHATEISCFDKTRCFHPGHPSPLSEKYFSSIMNEGDNSKSLDHFGWYQHILGAGQRDFLDCSPTGYKSDHNSEFELLQFQTVDSDPHTIQNILKL